MIALHAADLNTQILVISALAVKSPSEVKMDQRVMAEWRQKEKRAVSLSIPFPLISSAVLSQIHAPLL